MIKLIVTDMDGTFLNSQGDYDREFFLQVMALMNEKGVKFAPCTGKQCERVEELFGDAAHYFLILGDSAASIRHRGEYLYKSMLKNKLGLEMIERLKSLDLEHIVIACTEEGAFITSDTAPHLQALVRSSYAKLNMISSYSEIKNDFLKITAYNEEGLCFESKEELSDFFDKAYIVSPEKNWIDITKHGVNKGTSVEKLQKILGVTYEETMVFGDGLNDLELMGKGAFSFAMSNGFDETKSLANYIIRHNDDHSVMKTIIQFLTLQS